MEWVQAGGVLVAIAISLVTYIATNRRNDNQWQRDALLDAMKQFLNGSFARYSGRGLDAWRAESQNESRPGKTPFSTYVKRAQAGNRDQNDALTSLRLLAPADVVAAAEHLMAEDLRVEQWFRSPDPKQETWEDISDARQAQRAVFIDTYRRHFRLGKAKPIDTEPAHNSDRPTNHEPGPQGSQPHS